MTTEQPGSSDATDPDEPVERIEPVVPVEPDVPTADVSTDDVPTDDELARVARPATLRRAPRYRAFVISGALLGLVVALVAVLVAPATEGGYGPGPTFVFTGLGAALVGALLGGAVAVVLDRAGPR